MTTNVWLKRVMLAWVYGLVCGLGVAATTVGLLRGEALPGVLWPAVTPLLLVPLVILRLMTPDKAQRTS